ncbi:LysM peptidoglycan-binding domain-containing protein [Pseudomaricurvus alkylphenolicus]|uniref:FecR domain-containing protein n=1 Tax=Pseudomaricurvus alkylphenolicus TaxID=1306991 RepID=UPI001422AF44|nr:FecR domain-containing protein [Pseudomaricurvus alkylphenolicus]NIB39810.1 LysM peptidoglycan-binding domain-containing protein [Pseudomaricurvus alkylphenolicus]
MKRLIAAISLQLIMLAPAQSAEWLYSVRPDDTIWDVCLKYTNKRSCWMLLPGMNQIKNPYVMPPGQILRIPVSWLRVQPKPVEVTFVSGTVSVRESGQTRAVRVGDKLPIGAVVETAAGHVNLRFGDGSSLQLEPDSQLSLDAMTTHIGKGIVDSQLRLNQGAVKTRVIPRTPATRFRITTPTAVAAVRGTEYRVSASTEGDKGVMRGEVFEGLVEVKADKLVQSVAAGYGITAREDQPLENPKPLLPAPRFTSSDAPRLAPATVTWEALEGASRYQLELLNDNEGEELLKKLTPTLPRAIIDQIQPGCYRLRLRAIDADELLGLAASQTFCIAQPLVAPVLNPGLWQKQGRHAATLTWAAVPTAVSYRVQVATDAEFTQLLRDETQSATSLSLESKQALYVRVSAIGEEGQQTEFSNALPWQPGNYDWIVAAIYTLIIVVLW